ncbi:hypothetical protein [Helicobacter felistomachi]|uniref:hypothetical protein n=1 Tax=Helicobacter felistomachi TaxID=3040201 RepID=UPI002573C574|nr:hypothetical protein [Helicobacter sp. NHP21005]
MRCGLIRELIGRIPVRIVLENVDTKMLESAFDRAIIEYENEFLRYGSCLVFTPKAKKMIIDQTMQEGTGMRAIGLVLTDRLLLIISDLQEQKFVGHQCVITSDTLVTGRPHLVAEGTKIEEMDWYREELDSEHI